MKTLKERKPNAEYQRKFKESMQRDGYKRFQLWAPKDFGGVFGEFNKLIKRNRGLAGNGALNDIFSASVLGSLIYQKTIIEGAQALIEGGNADLVIEYIEECAMRCEMSAGLNVMTATPEMFLKRKAERQTMES